MKRSICLVLAIVLSIAFLSACSGGSEKKEQTTPAQTQSNTQGTTKEKAAPKVNRFGWEIPEETLEFTYYMGEQMDPEKAKANSVHMDEFLLKEFNVKLNKIVYNTDVTERLNLMLASNDYPEVIAGVDPNQADIFVKQGRALELTPYIDTVAPNIKSQLGELYVRYLDENGKLFVVPKCWGLLPIPDYSASIRHDYWIEIGSPEFTTPDEFYEVLKLMQAKHPTNAQGEKTYALSDFDGGTRMWKCLTGAWGIKSEYKEDANNNLTHWMNTDEGLEVVKFVNKVYREGQMDPDFATHTFETWMEKVTNQRIMGYIGAWWPTWTAGHMAWMNTVPDWKFEMGYINVKIKAPEAEEAYLSPKDTLGYYRSFITDKCKQPENVLKWWNFEISDIGTKIINWGIPDSEYSDWRYVDGQSLWNDEVIAAWETSSFDVNKYDTGEIGGHHWMVAGQQKLSNGDPRTGEWCNVWFDQNFNSIDKRKKILHENLKGTTFDNSYRNVVFGPDNPVTVINQQVSDILKTGWADMVKSKTEAECETKFYALREKLNKAGLHEIEKFRTDEYKKKLAAWK